MSGEAEAEREYKDKRIFHLQKRLHVLHPFMPHDDHVPYFAEN